MPNGIAVGKKFRRLSRFVLFSKIINFENRQIELIYIRKVAQTKTTKTKTKQKITNSINDSATEVCDEDVRFRAFVFILAQECIFIEVQRTHSN